MRILLTYCTLALLLVSCGTGKPTASGGAADWRVTSMVSAAEGSASIRIAGQTGAAWSARITDATWCSFRIGDPGASTREGTVKPAANQNILDVYYTANTGEEQREATIEISFAGQAPLRLILTQFPSSSTGGPVLHKKAWAELPEIATGTDYIYVSHFAPLGGSTVRNFSLCYDTELHAAHWVAYPLHTVYTGSFNREDKFIFDPKIDAAYQPNLTNRSYEGSSWDRGHQIPSADRDVSSEINAQTFYATNMTPQLGSLNQYMWKNLETKVRNNMCPDTLYVVTGCYYANTNTTTRDGARAMTCPTPTHYYKVLLRTANGSTGKRIADCSAGELQAIGFWVEQKSYGNIQPPASICTSVADIEQKTGFTFFPLIDEGAAAAVKAQNSPAKWGIQ